MMSWETYYLLNGNLTFNIAGGGGWAYNSERAQGLVEGNY